MLSKTSITGLLRTVTLVAAGFGMISAGVLLFIPEKIPQVSTAMSALGSSHGYKLPDSENVTLQNNTSVDPKAFQSFSKIFVNIAKNAKPGVVFILVQKTATAAPSFGGGGFPEDFFFPFIVPPREGGGVQRSAGSGFIVDLKNGYVITNHHVVEGADEVTVITSANDHKYTAKLVGSDKSVDVAVLKVEGLEQDKNLKQIGLGDSDKVEVGDWVAALGAPMQLPQTLTTGVVSALGRTSVISDTTAIEDFIQTDAAINPGNSGGPLLNLEGKVIGMNTAILSSSGTSAGIGFAVPSNMIRQVAEMIVADGKVNRGYLGIVMLNTSSLSDETLKSFNVPEDTKGALVKEIVPQSPAEKGGLKAGDIIQSLNGHSVTGSEQLKARIAFTKPGTDIKVGILRKGTPMNVTVKVGLNKDANLSKKKGSRDHDDDDDSKGSASQKLGLALTNITKETREDLNIRSKAGVLVSGVGRRSPAESAEFRSGDLILEINNKPVKKVKDAENMIESSLKNKAKMMTFLIEREGSEIMIVMKLGR